MNRNWSQTMEYWKNEKSIILYRNAQKEEEKKEIPC